MQILDTLSKITPDEWRIFIAITVGLCGLVGYIAHAVGKTRGWNDRRHDRDRDNVIVASLIFEPLSGGRKRFSIETDDQLPTLSQVFGNPHLERKIKNAVGHRAPGERLFKPGDDHYLAMERVSIHLTGPDPAATQAALFHRDGEYHTDFVATWLICAIGEDGIKMTHIIKANPKDLEDLGTPGFLESLVPLRQVHKRYLDVAIAMSREYTESKWIFKEATAAGQERFAGEKASVWTVPVRTQRALTEERAREIVHSAIGTSKAAAE